MIYECPFNVRDNYLINLPLHICNLKFWIPSKVKYSLWFLVFLGEVWLYNFVYLHQPNTQTLCSHFALKHILLIVLCNSLQFALPFYVGCLAEHNIYFFSICNILLLNYCQKQLIVMFAALLVIINGHVLHDFFDSVHTRFCVIYALTVFFFYIFNKILSISVSHGLLLVAESSTWCL